MVLEEAVRVACGARCRRREAMQPVAFTCIRITVSCLDMSSLSAVVSYRVDNWHDAPAASFPHLATRLARLPHCAVNIELFLLGNGPEAHTKCLKLRQSTAAASVAAQCPALTSSMPMPPYSDVLHFICALS